MGVRVVFRPALASKAPPPRPLVDEAREDPGFSRLLVPVMTIARGRCGGEDHGRGSSGPGLLQLQVLEVNVSEVDVRMRTGRSR